MSSFLSHEDYFTIARLLSFFSTGYGGEKPRLKLIRTLDHSMSICSSTSSRLQAQLKCQRRISRLLLSAIQKQIASYHDGGLYLSIIFCDLLLQFREVKNLLVFQSCLNLLDQMKSLSEETLTINSIQPLMALARAVICKPLAYKHSELLREQLCLLAVKSFLENLNLNQQLTLTLGGLDIEQSALYNGLLYQISTSDPSLCSKKKRSCLYFSVSLAGDYVIENIDHIETDAAMFEWIVRSADRIAKQILEYSCLHHGGIIFCQKVIHPSIKAELKQYGIATLDRLGRQYTSHLCYLLGCQPIETLTLNTLDQRYFGMIEDVQRVQIGQKQFLQLAHPTRSFHTLLLCSNTEQSLLELKECIHASQQSLAQTLQSKQVLYGGGCSESAQLLYLESQSSNPAVPYLSKTIRQVLRVQHGTNYAIDRIHGHLWPLSENEEMRERCACELYSATERFRKDWRSFCLNCENESLDQAPEELFRKELCARYLDNLQMRTGALRTAIETAINIQLTSVSL